MRYRGYLFDLDGTLFRGNEPIPSAVAKVRELRESGAIVRYVTNNSTQTRAYFAEKLSGMGYPCMAEEVVSSGFGTGRYMADQGLKTAYVIGEPGLIETLADFVVQATEEENPDAVVVGLCRQFDYEMLKNAMARIRSGARFVATNPDSTYPIEGGGLIPGGGSIVAAVRTCSETEPFIVGKPNPFLIQAALEDAGLGPDEALVVGDREDTDIESGRRAGCDTFLVLTGVAKSVPDGQMGGEDLSGLP